MEEALTPEEEAELARYEAEDALTPEEEAELAGYEAEDPYTVQIRGDIPEEEQTFSEKTGEFLMDAVDFGGRTVDRIGEAYEGQMESGRKRGAALYERDQFEKAGGQTSAESAGQFLMSNVAGGVTDLAGETIALGGKTIWDLAPDEFTKATEAELKEAMKHPIAQEGLAALNKGIKAYGAWKKENPRFAYNLEAGGMALGIAVPLKIRMRNNKKLVTVVDDIPVTPPTKQARGIAGKITDATSGVGDAATAAAVVTGKKIVNTVGEAAIEGVADVANGVASIGSKASVATYNKVMEKLTDQGSVVDGEMVIDKLPKGLKKQVLKAQKNMSEEDFTEWLLKMASSERTLLELGGKRIEGVAVEAAGFAKGREILGEGLEEMNEAAPVLMKRVLEKNVSNKRDFEEHKDAVTKAGQAEADVFYELAKDANPLMHSIGLDNLLGGKVGRKALEEVMEEVRTKNARVGDAEIAEMVDEVDYFLKYGGELPSIPLTHLNEMKKLIGGEIHDKNGVMKSSSSGSKKAALKELTDELKSLDKTGNYEKGLAKARDHLSHTNAMEAGTKFTNTDLEARHIAKIKADYESPSLQKAYKDGAAYAIRQKIIGAKGGSAGAWLADDLNAAKVKKLLGAKQYKELMDEAKATNHKFAIQKKVIKGQDPTEYDIATGLTNVLETGEGFLSGLGLLASYVATTKRVVKMLVGGVSNKQSAKIAEVLLEKDPQKQLAVILQMYKIAQKAQKKKGIRLEETEAGQSLQAIFDLEGQGIVPKVKARLDERQKKVLKVGAVAAAGAGVVQEANAMPSPSHEDIQMLLGNPDLAPEFDKAFGEGFADRIVKKPAPPPEPEAVPESLIQNEGRELDSYIDTTGHRTVGSGFNMDSGIAKRVWKAAGVPVSFDDVYKNKASITEEESTMLAQTSYKIAQDDAEKVVPSFRKLSPVRQEAVSDLSYQLGYTRFMKFVKFRAAMAEGNYKVAARELVNSKWYEQTQKSRTSRVIRQIIRG